MIERSGEISKLHSNIPKQIERRLASKAEGTQECRELYELLIGDFCPQSTLAYWIVYDIAKIMRAQEELQTVRDATFRAAMRNVVEQCLKDLPAADPEAHARYILSGAKRDAAAWQRSKASRTKINARLNRAGYDIQWIQAQAYAAAKRELEYLDRAIAFQEERRRRLINQLQPIESVLSRFDHHPGRLIEGTVGGTA